MRKHLLEGTLRRGDGRLRCGCRNGSRSSRFLSRRCMGNYRGFANGFLGLHCRLQRRFRSRGFGPAIQNAIRLWSLNSGDRTTYGSSSPSPTLPNCIPSFSTDAPNADDGMTTACSPVLNLLPARELSDLA